MDLKWYFKPWFMERCYADLVIETNDKSSIFFVNYCGLPQLVKLIITFEDGSQ